ncbi:MAG: uL15 family ribosomal protein [Candidatus Korarchaeota archaeon]
MGIRNKTKKMRGSRTCGFGRKARHRNSGQKGGYGHAGHFKHKKSAVYSGKEEYFYGKHGFRNPTSEVKKVINLDELGKLVSGKKIKEINLDEMGYDKVLGRGVFNADITVKCREFSKKAKEKLGNKAVVIE